MFIFSLWRTGWKCVAWLICTLSFFLLPWLLCVFIHIHSLDKGFCSGGEPCEVHTVFCKPGHFQISTNHFMPQNAVFIKAHIVISYLTIMFFHIIHFFPNGLAVYFTATHYRYTFSFLTAHSPTSVNGLFSSNTNESLDILLKLNLKNGKTMDFVVVVLFVTWQQCMFDQLQLNAVIKIWNLHHRLCSTEIKFSKVNLLLEKQKQRLWHGLHVPLCTIKLLQWKTIFCC